MSDLYPMRLVTKMTGLSADTVRAWERRYQAVTPHRTEGNTRRYSSRQIRRLLLLSEATRRGHSISSIARMDEPTLEDLLAKDRPGIDVLVERAHPDQAEMLRLAYVGAIARFDGKEGYEILTKAATFLNPEFFLEQVLLPILLEVEQRWSSPAVGHSQQQIFVHHLHGLVHAAQRTDPGIRRARVIVASPESESREMHALVAALFLHRAGLEPIYVGRNGDQDDLDWSVSMSRASRLLLVASMLRPLAFPVPLSVFDPFAGSDGSDVIRTWSGLYLKAQEWASASSSTPRYARVEP